MTSNLMIISRYRLYYLPPFKLLYIFYCALADDYVTVDNLVPDYGGDFYVLLSLGEFSVKDDTETEFVRVLVSDVFEGASGVGIGGVQVSDEDCFV